LWPCHLKIKKYLKAKEEEELWKFKYFSVQKYNLQKKSFKKKPKSFNKYYNTLIITNLKFPTQAKIISSFKNPHITIDLLFIA
jgi:hypothetical protein